MNLGTAQLKALRNATAKHLTSVCQVVAVTTTKNPDGSDNRTYATSGSTFKGSLQPMRGSQVPAPLALMNVQVYRLFTPAANVLRAGQRVRVDGTDYEVHDVENPRSQILDNQAYLTKLS